MIFGIMLTAGIAACGPGPAASTGANPAEPAAASVRASVTGPAAASKQEPHTPKNSPAVHQPTPSPTGEAPTAERQLRTIDSREQGGTITIRYGSRLDIVPAGRPGGWRVISYPHRILRLAGNANPADRHSFTAIAVGEGQVDLTAHDGPAETYTVRIRVVRDLIQRPQT